MKKKFIAGSRGSQLALKQTNWVMNALKTNHPELEFELKIIKTKGDLILDRPLDKIGDKGLFVKEIEQALLDGEIDFAVHSMKDMPGDQPEGLCFAQTPKREDPRDVIIFKPEYSKIEDLPEGARIGTGSKRRIFSLQRKRPDLVFVPIRGNIETRIRKIETEQLDGVILAAAGLHRLNLEERISLYCDPKLIVPAPAQGALAIEYRTSDRRMGQILNEIGDAASHATAMAERGFLKGVSGSCHLPIGASAVLNGRELELTVLFGNESGEQLIQETFKGSSAEPEALGEEAAKWVENQLMSNLEK